MMQRSITKSFKSRPIYENSETKEMEERFKREFEGAFPGLFLRKLPRSYAIDFAVWEESSDKVIMLLEYKQRKYSSQQMLQWGTLQSGCWIVIVNDLMQSKLIDPWEDCALHEECIAPKGAKLFPCKEQSKKVDYYECHKYDQSAINIILAREFGLKLYDDVVRNSKKLIGIMDNTA